MYDKLVNNFNYYSDKIKKALEQDNERVEVNSTSLINALNNYKKDKENFKKLYNYLNLQNTRIIKSKVIIVTNGNIDSLIEICLFCIENGIKAEISSSGILENTTKAIIQIINNTFENSLINYTNIRNIEDGRVINVTGNKINTENVRNIKEIKDTRKTEEFKEKDLIVCVDNLLFYKDYLKKEYSKTNYLEAKNNIIAISLNAIDIFYDSEDFEDIVNTLELYCDSKYIDYHTYKIKNQYSIKLVSNKEVKPNKAVILTKNNEKYTNTTYYKEIYINQNPFTYWLLNFNYDIYMVYFRWNHSTNYFFYTFSNNTKNK